MVAKQRRASFAVRIVVAVVLAGAAFVFLSGADHQLPCSFKAPPIPSALNISQVIALNSTGDLLRQDVSISVRFAMYLRNDSHSCGVCTLIIRKGRFAPVESNIYEHVLSHTPSSKRRVIDVGLNIGYFSMLAAAWGARVTAFEPGAPARTLARASVAAAGFDHLVTVHPHAVGATDSVGKMASSAVDWAVNEVVPASSGDDAADSVRVVRLADYAGPPSQRISILKVDTEGFELSVFEGALDVLPRVDYVIAEIKQWRSPAKLALLARIMQAGRFSHAYNYAEQYFSGAYPPTAVQMHDVTSVIEQLARGASPDDAVLASLTHEDFVFCRRPLELTILPYAAS